MAKPTRLDQGDLGPHETGLLDTPVLGVLLDRPDDANGGSRIQTLGTITAGLPNEDVVPVVREGDDVHRAEPTLERRHLEHGALEGRLSALDAIVLGVLVLGEIHRPLVALVRGNHPRRDGRIGEQHVVERDLHPQVLQELVVPTVLADPVEGLRGEVQIALVERSLTIHDGERSIVSRRALARRLGVLRRDELPVRLDGRGDLRQKLQRVHVLCTPDALSTRAGHPRFGLHS